MFNGNNTNNNAYLIIIIQYKCTLSTSRLNALNDNEI